MRIVPSFAVLCAGLVVASADRAAAQQPNVDFAVSGTSTVRSWSCNVKGVLKVTPATNAPAVAGFAGGVQAATVTVPVKAFKCPNDEMTQHLMDAMKPDQNAEITYRMEKYVVNGNRAEAPGTLTINGVTEPVTVPLTLEPSAGGVQVAGNTRVDMTKFRVDPPVVMMGLLKVGPQVRIEFKGIVSP